MMQHTSSALRPVVVAPPPLAALACVAPLQANVRTTETDVPRRNSATARDALCTWNNTSTDGSDAPSEGA